MTLGEVIARIDSFEDEHTIYVRGGDPATAESEAVVLMEPDDGGDALAEKGYRYFLEIDLAKEALGVWSDWRSGGVPSPSDALKAIVFYAERDAYLPLSEDPEPGSYPAKS